MRHPAPFYRGDIIQSFSADFLNGLREVLIAFDSGRLDLGGGGQPQASTGKILVQIQSAQSYPAFSVFGISDALVAPTQNPNSAKFNPRLKVVVPTVDHEHNIAILQQPGRPSPALVEAAIAGETVAIVNVTNQKHTHAMITPGSTLLASGFTGPLRLKYAPTTLGQQHIVVTFGSSRSDRHFLAVNGIPAATKDSAGTIYWGKALCNRYDSVSPGVIEPSSDQDWVYNSMPTEIASGKTVNTQLEDSLPVVIVEPCDDYSTGSGFDSGFDSGFGGSGFDTGFDTGFGA